MADGGERRDCETIVLVGVGGSVVIGLRLVESVVEFGPGLVALYAVLVAWVVFAPAAVGRVERGVLESSLP